MDSLEESSSSGPEAAEEADPPEEMVVPEAAELPPMPIAGYVVSIVGQRRRLRYVGKCFRVPGVHYTK